MMIMNIEVPEKASDLCTTIWERHHEKIKQIVHNKGLSDEHKLDAINKIVLKDLDFKAAVDMGSVPITRHRPK